MGSGARIGLFGELMDKFKVHWSEDNEPLYLYLDEEVDGVNTEKIVHGKKIIIKY